uniref:MyoD family inhibitor n=2 Tax=Oncorhynchus mykiss TaxID=8022 RepID=A0A8K9Y1E0_ONCMY
MLDSCSPSPSEPMDVERGPPVSSPEPPDDGDPCPPTDNPVPTPSPTPTPTTGQPQTRSTPIHPTQPCLTQPTSQLRNGAKPHTHTPHCTHTANTHASHPNGVRNGGLHDRPAPNSLPRAASSSSSCSSSEMKNPKKLQSNPSITSQSSKRSKSSSKSNSSQIPIEAQDDCCVHCILACLFCEFLTLCNIVLDCATCGSCAGDDSACFCCCCASEECGDCELPCDMDCGIIDACCESADCLEICMECCGLCFSS